jgi:hypothetical protein
MNLDSLVKTGELPWSPCPEIKESQVWHVWNHPLVGTYRTPSGDLVLFTVVSDDDGDEDHRLSVWAYVPVAEGDEARFDRPQFATGEELGEFVAGYFTGKEAVLGLADDLVLVHWGPTVSPVGAAPDGLPAAAAQFMTKLIAAAGPAAELQAVLSVVQLLDVAPHADRRLLKI